MMRILVGTDQWFPDLQGGVARVARQVAEGLAERGHEQLVLAPAVPRAAYRDELTVNADDSTATIDIWRAVRRGVLPQTFTDPRQISKAVSTLDLAEFDVILTHHVTSTVGFARCSGGPPIVSVFHASPLREAIHRRASGLSRVNAARSLTVEPLLRRYENQAAHASHEILTLSNYSRQLACGDLRVEERRKVTVVGGGVRTDLFRPVEDRAGVRSLLGISNDEFVLLTVRRLVQRMGVDLLLQAVAVTEWARPIRVVIVGEGELRGELEREAASLGLSDAVSFLGSIDDAALCRWYNGADLFCLPSTAYEGFGMVTAEALASGLPVIGTRVGATEEILGTLDANLLIGSVSPQGISQALERVLPKLGPALRERCRQYALEHLSWKSVLDRWESALARAARIPGNTG